MTLTRQIESHQHARLVFDERCPKCLDPIHWERIVPIETGPRERRAMGARPRFSQCYRCAAAEWRARQRAPAGAAHGATSPR